MPGRGNQYEKMTDKQLISALKNRKRSLQGNRRQPMSDSERRDLQRSRARIERVMRARGLNPDQYKP